MRKQRLRWGKVKNSHGPSQNDGRDDVCLDEYLSTFATVQFPMILTLLESVHLFGWNKTRLQSERKRRLTKASCAPRLSHMASNDNHCQPDMEFVEVSLVRCFKYLS